MFVVYFLVKENSVESFGESMFGSELGYEDNRTIPVGAARWASIRGRLPAAESDIAERPQSAGSQAPGTYCCCQTGRSDRPPRGRPGAGFVPRLDWFGSKCFASSPAPLVCPSRYKGGSLQQRSLVRKIAQCSRDKQSDLEAVETNFEPDLVKIKINK